MLHSRRHGRATVWAVCFMLALRPGAGDAPPEGPVRPPPLAVSSAAWDTWGATLARVLCGTSARLRPAAPPPACLAPPDSRACRTALLRALAAEELALAVVVADAGGVEDARLLRDTGLQELGSLGVMRRVCRAGLPARSLLDLSVPDLAARYALPGGNRNESACGAEVDPPCAALLVANEGEAFVLRDVVRHHNLHADVHVVTEAGAESGGVRCGWEASGGSDEQDTFKREPALGPPPCLRAGDCAFEARRLLKLGNLRVLARAASALSALSRAELRGNELGVLMELSARLSPDEAARQLDVRHSAGSRNWRREVRVGALVPLSARGDVGDALALAGAAAQAERDEEAAADQGRARFKVEVYDAACSTARAYKWLGDALGGGEWAALSAAAGPLCAAPFADVARQAPAHRLPLLAYSPQPLPQEGSSTALLTAGSSEALGATLRDVLAALNWRRVAAVADAAQRAGLAVALAQAERLALLELPPAPPQLDTTAITQWATRAASQNARILLLWTEDARALRATLCAGAAAGLVPGAGAVWLLAGAMPPAMLRAARGEACGADTLRAQAEGLLAVGAVGDSAERGAPARLYDALRLWAAALARLEARDPAALDDLHAPDTVQWLVQNATGVEYCGRTGCFEWNTERGARVRRVPLQLEQWRNGSAHDTSVWRDGRLQLQPDALRWAVPDAPDDGAEHCAVRALAELLGADCRAAWVALAAMLLAAAMLALLAAALMWRRRAEREYRARLAALGPRGLDLGALGLDRWELPRDRVVINRKLGVGAFGTVYGGHALLAEERGWTAVAVKTLRTGATTEEKLDFLSEAEAMKRFEHKNVVRLLGVVTKTEPVCTVMEFVLYGDLKSYLLARRHLAAGDAADEVSPRRLTAMALDAARALSYLAQQRYVHRDVAARNCLVTARRGLKLADFGMARLVFENDYYRFSRKGLLPVRWMAPESLALGVFSAASDVWAFGVLLYEMVTFGALPYQGLSNHAVLAHVKQGRSLDLPPGLKPQLEALMKSCWQRQARARPSASAVAAFLADSPRLLTPCLDAPLDALPLQMHERLPGERAPARWVSWEGTGTDVTYVQHEDEPAPDAFPADFPPDITAGTFTPTASDNFPPSAADTFPPIAVDTFPPPASDTFPAVEKNSYPPEPTEDDALLSPATPAPLPPDLTT